jgi:transketolase
LVNTLCLRATHDPRLVLLTADLGYGFIEPFANRFPKRFFNVGVAEQSMIATATGLAEAGFIPYCYSIASFASLRALEFIRNGPVAHNLPVKVIAVGPGTDYGIDGFTHHALDDIGVIRAIGGVSIVTPNSTQGLRKLLDWAHAAKGPTYIRIPRTDAESSTADVRELEVYGPVRILSLGDADMTGQELKRALAARGYNADHACVTVISSDSHDTILKFAAGASILVVVENHYVWGGLGTFVIETLEGIVAAPVVIRMGYRSPTVGPTGSATHLRQAHLDISEVVAQVEARLS